MSGSLERLGESFAALLHIGGPLLLVLAVLHALLWAALVLRAVGLWRGFRGRVAERLAFWQALSGTRPALGSSTSSTAISAAKSGRRLSWLDETLRQLTLRAPGGISENWVPRLRIARAGRQALRTYQRSIRALTFSAPLLGLLGTVHGMVRTFEALGAQGGGANVDALSAGISHALVTTEVGLVAAVAGLLGGRGLEQLAKRRDADFDALDAAIEPGVIKPGTNEHKAIVSPAEAPC